MVFYVIREHTVVFNMACLICGKNSLDTLHSGIRIQSELVFRVVVKYQADTDNDKHGLT